MPEDIYDDVQNKVIAGGNNHKNKNDISQLILILICELSDRIDCLQRAMAMLCAQFLDFKAESLEDNAELKRMLHELRKNKVWIERGRV
jgi:hypothetical protein